MVEQRQEGRRAYCHEDRKKNENGVTEDRKRGDLIATKTGRIVRIVLQGRGRGVWKREKGICFAVPPVPLGRTRDFYNISYSLLSIHRDVNYPDDGSHSQAYWLLPKCLHSKERIRCRGEGF